LRDEFIRGAFGEDAVPAPAARPTAVRRPAARAWSRGLAALGAAAAVLVVGLAAWSLNPGPRWRPVGNADVDGNVMIDGEPVPAGDLASLEDALAPGATLEWRGHGDLALVSQGQLALAIAPGTRMTLPEPPPRWFGRTTHGRVEEGEIRLTSGPGFHGARVSITTPQATVAMIGTTLAVICEPMGTCVCVFEGEVRVTAGAHDMGMVPAGHRQVVFADGRTPERAEIRPNENVELGRMRETMRPMLGR